jgi:GAF domain-containing protein
VGTAGATYAQGTEVVVADSAELDEDRFKIAGLYKAHDRDRYRSLVGVPVLTDISEDARPWGVVVGTNDQANHFSEDEPGRHKIEAIRAVAEMVAHAVIVLDDMASLAGDGPPPVGEEVLQATPGSNVSMLPTVPSSG